MTGRLSAFLAKLSGFWRQTPSEEEPSIAKEREVQVQRRYYLIDIPRFEGASDPPPLSWKACHPSTVHRFKAQLTCPKGHGLVLKGHSIDARGRVYPSVVCMTDSCEFHEFVRLVGWDFGPLA